MHRQTDRQTSEQGSEQMAGQTDRRDSDFWQMKIPLLTAASQGPKTVAAWGTAVAASADDVGLALALPALYLALAAAGALWVALAGCRSGTSVGPGLPCPHQPTPAHALSLLSCPPCHGHRHILTHCPRQGSTPAHSLSVPSPQAPHSRSAPPCIRAETLQTRRAQAWARG